MLANEDQSQQDIFAKVNGEIITKKTYLTVLRAGGRQRFYHGKAPETEIIEFRKEIGQNLIDERLLHQEAKRLNIVPDLDWVSAEFAKIEQQYSASPQWLAGREALANEIKSQLRERSQILLIKRRLSEVDDPTEAELNHYYISSKEVFTSPEQIKVSSILLPVEPWQSKDVWDATRKKAEEIRHEISSGANFEIYSKQYQPKNWKNGSYTHRGMLGETAQIAIDNLQPGGISDVVDLLEGTAIFRLDDRLEAKLNPLEKVRDRAIALWKRDRQESTRELAIQSLRDKATIVLADPEYQFISDPFGVSKTHEDPGSSVN